VFKIAVFKTFPHNSSAVSTLSRWNTKQLSHSSVCSSILPIYF